MGFAIRIDTGGGPVDITLRVDTVARNVEVRVRDDNLKEACECAIPAPDRLNMGVFFEDVKKAVESVVASRQGAVYSSGLSSGIVQEVSAALSREFSFNVHRSRFPLPKIKVGIQISYEEADTRFAE